MGKFGNRYNVYDMQTGKVIIVNAVAEELVGRFVRHRNCVAHAARNDTTIKGRYKIYISSDTFEKEWADITQKLLKYPEIIRKIRLVEEYEINNGGGNRK